MGLNFKKAAATAAKIEQHLNDFQPIELTEGNVEAVFNRCLKTDKTVKELDKPLYIIDGKGLNPDGYVFDQDVVDANKKTIRYLIGQLKAIHECESELFRIDLKDVYLNYSNLSWCNSGDAVRDRKALLKLCHLVCIIDCFTPIFILDKDYHITPCEDHYTPTLSPRDPNFPAWWEAHKAEWEG